MVAKQNPWSELFQEFSIHSKISEVQTPYVFFIEEPFDFQPEEANFHRMILQAEEQRLAFVVNLNSRIIYLYQITNLGVNYPCLTIAMHRLQQITENSCS